MGKLWFHRIKHWLRLQGGYADGFWEGEKLMMCFVCRTCGERSRIFDTGKRKW